MGCCLSTTTSEKQPPKSNPHVFPPNPHHHLPESDVNNGGAPPPPLPLQEETVKQVLSETPIPKPKPKPNPQPLAPIPNHDEERKKTDQLRPVVAEAEVKMIESPMAVIQPQEGNVSDPSGVSEMCSFSESLSTATTEKRDDDSEVNQRAPRSRPCSGRRERGIRTPLKRNQVPTAARGNVGERSGRRRRSPSSGREVGVPPVRYKNPNLTATGRKPTEAVVEKKGEEKELSETTTESLENPLVSLECFIFL